jgi:hypothetical protein
LPEEAEKITKTLSQFSRLRVKIERTLNMQQQFYPLDRDVRSVNIATITVNNQKNHIA